MEQRRYIQIDYQDGKGESKAIVKSIENIEEIWYQNTRRIICFDLVETKGRRRKVTRYASEPFQDWQTLIFRLVDKKYDYSGGDRPQHHGPTLCFPDHEVLCHKWEMTDISDLTWWHVAKLCPWIVKVIYPKWMVPQWVPVVGGWFFFPTVETGLMTVTESENGYFFGHPALGQMFFKIDLGLENQAVNASGFGIRIYRDVAKD